jgi:hypothetical protein
MTTTPLQPYDIYNLNTSFKREQRHRLSANDALLQHLKDKGAHFKIDITSANRIRRLFIAYPQSLQLAQTNQDVILVDNTYKTNKFDIPLLHIIGQLLLTFYTNLYTNQLYRYYKLWDDILNWILLSFRRNKRRLYIGFPVFPRSWNQPYYYNYGW